MAAANVRVTVRVRGLTAGDRDRLIMQMNRPGQHGRARADGVRPPADGVRPDQVSLSIYYVPPPPPLKRYAIRRRGSDSEKCATLCASLLYRRRRPF